MCMRPRAKVLTPVAGPDGGGCLASRCRALRHRSRNRWGSALLSKALLAASRRPGLRRVVTGTPVTRRVVDRFVAGETLPEALDAVRTLAAAGLAVTMDHLGEDVTDRREAERSR